MRGYDEYNTLLLPPRPVNEKLPTELVEFYDGELLFFLSYLSHFLLLLLLGLQYSFWLGNLFETNLCHYYMCLKTIHLIYIMIVCYVICTIHFNLLEQLKKLEEEEKAKNEAEAAAEAERREREEKEKEGKLLKYDKMIRI